MKTLFLALLILNAASTFAQKSDTLSYAQLKDYEGIYQYSNHTTIKMAAPASGKVLIAILNQSHYTLKPGDKDVFYDGGHRRVGFFRDSKGMVIGYTVEKDTLKLITKNVVLPGQMWYPRIVADPKNFRYQYKTPTDRHDGLPVEDISKTVLDTALLATMMHKIVAGDYPNVHSVLILDKGKLVFEEYFYEFNADSVQEERSATKSVISALTGIAIHQGLIKSVDEKALQFFPDLHPMNDSPLKDGITIKDMLTNQSGLNYDEAYDKSIGNETAMGHTGDWIKYTLDLPMLDTPGTKGRYASGNPIIVGRIIEKASGMPLHDFAVKNLFGPMGITNFRWHFKTDLSEAEDFCQVYLRPRDMAKFGKLILDNGVWQNKQLVPAEWVAESTSKHSVVQGVDYGYLWWLKHLDADGTRYYGVAAQGNGGQKIYIFRQQQLVIVVTGGNYNSQSPSDELIKKYILPAFNKK
jgi:CubicO group peptidase (beta-lactamase class C family)